MPIGVTPLVVKLLVFAIAILPLLVDNVRTSRVTNRNNLILFVAGAAMIAVDHGMGWSDRSLWTICAWLILGGVGLIVLAATGVCPGGVAKTLMALLPWFTTERYFLVIAAGFILSALFGYATRRETPVVVPLAIACFAVWLFDISNSVAV